MSRSFSNRCYHYQENRFGNINYQNVDSTRKKIFSFLISVKKLKKKFFNKFSYMFFFKLCCLDTITEKDKKRRPKSYQTSKCKSYTDTIRELIHSQMQLIQTEHDNHNMRSIKNKKRIDVSIDSSQNSNYHRSRSRSRNRQSQYNHHNDHKKNKKR